MSENKHETKLLDGFKLSVPPTVEEIDAVQRRISNYTDPSNPRPDRLDKLCVQLDIFSEGLSDHPRNFDRETRAIRELANLAFDCANDLRVII